MWLIYLNELCNVNLIFLDVNETSWVVGFILNYRARESAVKTLDPEVLEFFFFFLIGDNSTTTGYCGSPPDGSSYFIGDNLPHY